MNKNEVAKIFGEEIRKIRAEVGISQERLALEADVDRSFLSKMERGIRQPSLTVLLKLCRALEYSPDKLVSEVSSKLSKT